MAERGRGGELNATRLVEYLARFTPAPKHDSISWAILKASTLPHPHLPTYPPVQLEVRVVWSLLQPLAHER